MLEVCRADDPTSSCFLILFASALCLPFPLAVPDGAGASSLISTTEARVLVPVLAGANAAADDAAAAADDVEADARVLCGGGGALGEASVPDSLEIVDSLEEDF